MTDTKKEDQQIGRWPGDQERQDLAFAMSELFEMAYPDCYGSDNLDQGKKCDCSTCVAKRARTAIRKVLYPEVRSLAPKRLQFGVREKVFFEVWKRENQRSLGVNYGRGILEILIEELGPVVQRDMDVATAVIQWLGTNCGQAFLHTIENETKRIREEAKKSQAEATSNLTAVIDKHGLERPVEVGITEEQAKEGVNVIYYPSPGKGFSGVIDGPVFKCGDTPCVHLHSMQPEYAIATGRMKGCTTVKAAALCCMRLAFTTK